MQSAASRSLRLPAQRGLRSASSTRYASTRTIQDVLTELVPERQEYAKKIKAELGDKTIGEIKVEHVFGGMRGLKVMLWDPSVLDANEGIRFWGRTIPECQEVLPPAPGGKQMLPESMLWYLITGKVPTAEEARQFTLDLAQRSEISEGTKKIIDSFPKTLHPMTQFIAATASLNHDSAFAKGYENGMAKADYWKPTLEDSLDLCAKVFTVAGRIFNNVYRDGAAAPAINKDKDLCHNFANALGYGDNEGFIEVLRLYNSLHTDHEGGNVSAHTSHLVGSALSDPFLSYSAALAGLAGPLHGLANQEVLSFILGMIKEVGPDASDEQIVDHLWALLKSKRVVPGYGHAVLRKPDPRFLALQQFGANDAGISKDPVFKLVNKLYKLAPGVLTEHGKTKNPFPNVDAGSGSLLYHYGLKQQNFYTVLFGTSRALGCVGQLVWSRALGLPIERPKSMSMEALEAFAKKQ